MSARPQRRALGALFLVLAILFALIAAAALRAGGDAIVVAIAAAVLGLWLLSMALNGLRAR